MVTTRKKIGIIIQRYGKEVNGGAEVHARLIAEQLKKHYTITVLTSRALDYTTWEPHYPKGWSNENGIDILRFDNSPRTTKKIQSYWKRKARGGQLVQMAYRTLGKPAWWLRLFPKASVTNEDGMQWLEAQGPAMPQLLTYLHNEESRYTAFIVFTALYYPGALAALTVPEKVILVPTMHDEKASYIPFYQKVMAAPAWLFFNTQAEQDFSENLFQIKTVNKQIVGVGIELLKNEGSTSKEVHTEMGINSPYLIYVGRIEKGKGCDILVNYFSRFIHETGKQLQLVLVGKKLMPLKSHPAIVATGFVADAVKEDLMQGAQALVVPSLHESLSLVLLEGFACGIPVIANGKTQVLRDHIQASVGGWCFTDYESFKTAVEACFDNAQKESKGAAGYQYVAQNYSWNKVKQQFDEAIADIEIKTKKRRD